MSEDSHLRTSDIAALTARMTRGDELAYREFYDSYFHRLLGYLLVVTGGREDAAKEALQATLVRVVWHIKPFQSEEAFWSWLTVLARSCVIDEHRKQTRYLSFLGRLFSGDQAAAQPTAEDSDEQLIAALESNLASLSADDRDLIERKYYSRQSVKEIALALGATDKAIELRLARARRKLKDLVLAELRHE